jgi:hypothetical protein
MSDESEPHWTIVLGINAPDIVEFKPSMEKINHGDNRK